ncbi:MAG: glycosyltransferase [Clostridiales Family XIII bacterium]|jgi:glycosyltransferase involved in cell wall biosynthesis|nr:glycosyltransferase [Clostridiales Family XIII bacterium]
MNAQETDVTLSVIVPVYNVARYIRDCLNSLTAQSADGVEIVCVDDGSTDGSMDIVESIGNGDARVKTHYNEHAGPGATRNTGLAHALGRYVLFVDSDDMLAEGAMETLIARADELNTDILCFGGETVYETPELEKSHPQFRDAYRRKTGSTEVMTGPELLVFMRDAKDYKPSCVMQIYSREFIEKYGLHFEEGIIHEDRLFVFATLLRAKRAAVLDKPLYVRRIREGSIMTTPRSFDNVYGYYVAMNEMLRVLKDIEPGTHLEEKEYLAAFHTIRGTCNLSAKMYDLVDNDDMALKMSGVNPFDRAFMDLTVQPAWRNRALIEKKEQLKEKISEQKALISELKKQQRELERIKKSFSYRLGRALTALPRRLRAVIKRN